MKSRYVVKQQKLIEVGPHEGVIAVVDYKPDVETDFGVQNQVRLGIDTDQDDENGDPIRVPLTLHDSLHPSAQLYKVLVQLKKDPKPGFDFNTLLGLPVEYEIEHNSGKDGRVWNNIKNKDLRPARTAEQKAADERSEKRARQAIEGVRQQQQQPKPKPQTQAKEEAPLAPKKNGGVKPQREEAKKKATPRPEPEKYQDDEPLFPLEDEKEISSEDIPE